MEQYDVTMGSTRNDSFIIIKVLRKYTKILRGFAKKIFKLFNILSKIIIIYLYNSSKNEFGIYLKYWEKNIYKYFLKKKILKLDLEISKF